MGLTSTIKRDEFRPSFSRVFLSQTGGRWWEMVHRRGFTTRSSCLTVDLEHWASVVNPVVLLLCTPYFGHFVLPVKKKLVNVTLSKPYRLIHLSIISKNQKSVSSSAASLYIFSCVAGWDSIREINMRKWLLHTFILSVHVIKRSSGPGNFWTCSVPQTTPIRWWMHRQEVTPKNCASFGKCHHNLLNDWNRSSVMWYWRSDCCMLWVSETGLPNIIILTAHCR